LKNTYRIGEVSKKFGLNVETLRYYEKIGLLKPVYRSHGGIRLYERTDIDRIKFILRAKMMNFTLNEIKSLLEMRERPQQMREDARAVTRQKLVDIERQISELKVLSQELHQLLDACCCSQQGCPILENLDGIKE